MLIIHCPLCGPRADKEFTYGGDANRTRPGDDADEAAWYDYVFLRDNPKGWHIEFWQHAQGCRAWLKVERHTVTHEIRKVTACRNGRNG